MTIQEFYERINGDYADMRERIPADALIASFVKKFPQDGTYERLLRAVDAGDTNACFEAAHNLKGLAANLSFSKLYLAASALSEQLRTQKEPANQALVQTVTDLYESILCEIRALEE